VLPLIKDTLPSMFTAIRMVWTISRHYNTPERMGSLLQVDADCLAGVPLGV